MEEGEELAEKPGVDSFAHVAVVPAAHPAGAITPKEARSCTYACTYTLIPKP